MAEREQTLKEEIANSITQSIGYRILPGSHSVYDCVRQP